MTYQDMITNAAEWQVAVRDEGNTVIFEKNAIAWMERIGRLWRAYTRGSAGESIHFGPTTKARAADWCISSAVDPR